MKRIIKGLFDFKENCELSFCKMCKNPILEKNEYCKKCLSLMEQEKGSNDK